MTAPLDPISRRILQLLVADGRASYQAIADEVGLSRPAVMERVKRMEESGLILGYTARLDRAKLGFPITAFVRSATLPPNSMPRSRRSGRSPPTRASSNAITSRARTATSSRWPPRRSRRSSGFSAPSGSPALRPVPGPRSCSPPCSKSRASCRWSSTDMGRFAARPWSPTCWSARSGARPTWRSGSASPTCRHSCSPGSGSWWPGSCSAARSCWRVSGCPRGRATGARSPSPACSCWSAPTPSSCGRAVRRVGHRERVRGVDAPLGGLLRCGRARRQDAAHLADRGGSRARLPRERPPGRHHAA